MIFFPALKDVEGGRKLGSLFDSWSLDLLEVIRELGEGRERRGSADCLEVSGSVEEFISLGATVVKINPVEMLVSRIECLGLRPLLRVRLGPFLSSITGHGEWCPDQFRQTISMMTTLGML